jgi:CHAT domain-containing protein
VPSAWRPCRKALGAGHVVEEAQCGAVSTPSPAPCDEIITTHEEALRILTLQPGCTDAAIGALERFARNDAGAMSDVVAAYEVRAQREDRPSDLLRAFEAAEQAVAAAPNLPAVTFNRALIQENLGFSAAAMVSWDEIRRRDHGPWGAEARGHRTRLARERAQDARTQWHVASAKLPAALQARNRSHVAWLIARVPSRTARYLLEEMLPKWADAPSPEKLAAAAILAGEWSRVTGDRFALDVVEEIAASPAKIDALRKGLRAFREGRLAEEAIEPEKAAAAYTTAAESLARGGNSLRLLAEIGLAVQVSFGPERDAFARASSMLDGVEVAAGQAGYGSVLARVAATRAYFLEFQGRYVESLTELDTAQRQYARIHDEGNVAAVRGNRSSILVAVGQYERAWSEAWQAIRAVPRIVELQPRHRILGETAAAALALGHPRIALLYQDAALRLIHNEIATTPPENLRRIRKLQKNLAIALRHRAAIELRLEHYQSATANLDEAVRLAKEEGDANIRRLMEARVEEVLGQSLLTTDAGRADAAFTRAIELAAVDEYPTFRAALLAQRADARRRSGRRSDAEIDLRAALAELRKEEELVLQHRGRGSGEGIWSSYFSRSQETYRLLIRQLIAENRPEEAFRYAENARAFEPLDLVRHLHTLPKAFRRIEHDGKAMDVPSIRAALPRGTFVVEYCVTEDRTYTWILSRDSLVALTQQVPRSDINRWTEALQRAARKRDAAAFGAGLFAPYDALIARPLAAIRAMPHDGEPVRLVFVPDGAMHGLPFAALQDPLTRRHLIEEAPVEIAGSTALYLFSLIQDQALPKAVTPSIFLIGDPRFDEHLALAGGLTRLPHAEREVERIRDLYAPHAEVLTGAEATVPAFLEGSRENTIAHIAAHGIVNAEAPSRSLLLLAPSAAQTGVLDAEELLTQLKLDRTRLVVLSACSSAGGLPVGPEGVAPLVRSLIAAGVPAVIGSLWDVEDATAEELLVSFHRHYRQGSDAAVAMQSAQLDLLRNKNPGLRSVFAWAPFQVIGHASSPYALTH